MRKQKSERQKVFDQLDKLNGVKKKPKVVPLDRVENKLWALCKRIIRKTYGNTCYTCGKKDLSGIKWQTGHYIPRSVCGAYLKYDLRNLRPQCVRCNKWLGGNWVSFRERLILLEGEAYVDQIHEDKCQMVDAREHWECLVELYQLKAEELKV